MEAVHTIVVVGFPCKHGLKGLSARCRDELVANISYMTAVTKVGNENIRERGRKI